MKRRKALQASMAGIATVLVPSLALGSTLEIPDADYILVDQEGQITFVGDWPDRDFEEDLIAHVELLRTDPDHQVFTNVHMVCVDRELQPRVHCLIGASVAEVDAERDRWEQRLVPQLRIRYAPPGCYMP